MIIHACCPAAVLPPGTNVWAYGPTGGSCNVRRGGSPPDPRPRCLPQPLQPRHWRLMLSLSSCVPYRPRCVRRVQRATSRTFLGHLIRTDAQRPCTERCLTEGAIRRRVPLGCAVQLLELTAASMRASNASIGNGGKELVKKNQAEITAGQSRDQLGQLFGMRRSGAHIVRHMMWTRHGQAASRSRRQPVKHPA